MNKKFTFLALFIFSIFSSELFSQKYWVKFTDKNGTPYSVSTPSAYLSPKSIQRRTNQGIAINQSDLPVTPSYVSQVDAVSGVTVLYRSKWMNGIVISVTNTNVISTINSLSFVSSTSKVNKYKIDLPVVDNSTVVTSITNGKEMKTQSYDFGPSIWQAAMLGVDCMHELGFRGQGMTIAVMDNGFKNVNTNAVFDSLRMENRLLGTRDFVAGDTVVFDDGDHGAMVLSTMAGNSPGVIIGTAPKAKYWLLVSEDNSAETMTEEYNWIRAAEFADSVGADICTTSLGYNTFDTGPNHTYSQLNGKTAPLSIAATMAARKGMFILNAAGNEGISSWHYICVPADADSICTVGAVDAAKNKANFSSFGPTADGRIKPDLSAPGSDTWVITPAGGATQGSGTSFATPILAGAVACIWQAKPTVKNIQLLNALRQYASNSLAPNNNIGWGIPDVCYLNNSTTIGIKENEASGGLMMFPNPVSDLLHISTKEQLKNIHVTDVLGKTVVCEISLSDSEYVINTSAFEPGVYFINATSEQKNIIKKFVKD